MPSSADAYADRFDDVHTQLRKIRSANRLDATTVKRVAPVLHELPAVIHEVLERSWAPKRWPDAAVEVIICAIDRQIPHYVHRTLLRHTLNVPGIATPVTSALGRRKREVGIRERLEAARIDLRWSENSETELKKKDRESYRELASTLVRLRITPCRGGDAEDSILRDHMHHSVNRRYEAIIRELDEVQRLNALGVEGDAALRDEVRRLILESFPVGHAKAERLGGTAPTRALFILVDAILQTYYTWNHPVYGDGNDQLRRSYVMAESYANVDQVLPADILGNFLFSQDGERLGLPGGLPFELPYRNARQYIAIYRTKVDSLYAVTHYMKIAEKDGWSILDGYQSNDRVTPIR